MADLIVLLTPPMFTGANTPEKLSVIIPLSSISDSSTFDPLNQDIMFFDSGRVKRFVLNKIPLMSIFDAETKKFRGYFSETKFWENNVDNLKTNATTASIEKLGEPFSIYSKGNLGQIKPDDEVVLANVSLGSRVRGGNNQGYNFDIYYRYKRIPYAVLNPILAEVTSLDSSNISTYELKEVIVPISEQVSNYGNYVLRKGLLRADGTISAFGEEEEKVFLDIMRVFEIIETEQYLKDALIRQNLYAPFEAHLSLFNRYSKDYDQLDEAYHNFYTDEYFAIFRLKLIQFRYWLLQYKGTNYSTIHPTDLKMHILDLFTSDELALLPYQFKIDLLESLFIEKNSKISYLPNLTVAQQEAIVKLVQSIYVEREGQINYTEINDFFRFLRKDILINKGLLGEQRPNYYEILYNGIDDPLLFGDDGRGRKGQFVHAVYNLWTLSKYNPGHEDPIIAKGALSNFSYSNFPDYEKHLYVGNNQRTAAPPILNYHSDKKVLWYVDDFKFKFEKGKVVVTEKVWGDKDFGERDEELTIGYYDHFQPVVVTAMDALETIITLPIKTITSSNPTRREYADNAIPIFYLKYVDDLGDYSDFKQTVRAVIDVASLYYGISSVSNYSRALSLLRNAEGEFVISNQVLLRLQVGLITSAAEALSSAASIIYQLLTSDCEVYYASEQIPPNEGEAQYPEYSFCIAANKWLFAIEMLSMSANALSRYTLKVATRRMIEAMNPEIANKFTIAQRNCLYEIGDLGADVSRYLNQLNNYPGLKNRLSTLGDFKKYEFVVDFPNTNRKVLEEFENDLTLLDEWFELKYSPLERRSIQYLKNYKFIKSDVRKHAFEGHVIMERHVDEKVNTVVKVTGMHLGRKINTTPPYYADTWSFRNNEYIENTLGYRRGIMERTMGMMDIDPKTGSKWVNSGDANGPKRHTKRKIQESATWPKEYSDQEILEHMTKAFSNKVIIPKKKPDIELYRGEASDGMTIECMKDQNGLWSIYPSNIFIQKIN